MPEEWITVEKPGYFGKKRDELYARWNSEYGQGNWRIAWQWSSKMIEKPEALQIYEDSYYEFLKERSGILEWLVKTASDVYDTAPTNIQAGFSYVHQETPNNHIHDVAIRRSVMRLGKWFKGDHLMHVRGKGTEGERLSPHLVPFHLPDLIYQGDIKDYRNKGIWWRELGIKYSVEELYQQNKILQARLK